MYIIAKVAWTIISNLPTVVLVGVLSFGSWKLYGIWSDAKDNREYKESVEAVIADQNAELQNRYNIINELENDLNYSREREKNLTMQMEINRKAESLAKEKLDKDKLERVSEKIRFGDSPEDENTLLSNRMQKATEKVWFDIEAITNEK